MKTILSICKKILIVFGIIMVILLGAVCCDSESVDEQPVETKQEATVEKQENKNNNASDAGKNNSQNNKKNVQSEDSDEGDYTGSIFIVDTDGTTLGYGYDSSSGVYEMGERYAPEIADSVPYVAWCSEDYSNGVFVATANADGSWSIDENELSKIPDGWQWFVNTAINKASSYTINM